MTLFHPPQIEQGKIVPRPYQIEALQALDEHIRTKKTNPCVVIPTGGGKSILMAWIIQQWKREHPPLRVVILAHRKELVEQNSTELKDLWPGGDIGIYSAALKRRDYDSSILYASIDSIYDKWGKFSPFDVIIVDEAHRIPVKGEGKYRQFISGCKSLNREWIPVVGFTATPNRLGCGPICHRDHILNEICYSANIGDLINQGYLCKLRSKIGDIQPDMDLVKKNSGGDYTLKSLGEAIDTPGIVQEAMRSAVKIIIAEKRNSVLFFCVDVKHSHDVSMELRKYGLDVPAITGKTPQVQRTRIAEAFKAGQYRAICNVNVYTEGFNAKQVDCIVLLRPTLSKGLYVQMVGRGLRTHPSKKDCLVLDYARCIDEHGPIDCVEADEVKVISCGKCGDAFSRAVRICPNCGWEIPKQEIERMEAEAKEKRMHEAEHSNRSILSSEPETLKVNDVFVERHKKPGKPDSIRVQYRCGLSVFREWICLDHGGVAEKKAREWWFWRFGGEESKTITVDTALQDMFLNVRIKDVTKAITVLKQGKHDTIVDYQIKQPQSSRQGVNKNV